MKTSEKLTGIFGGHNDEYAKAGMIGGACEQIRYLQDLIKEVEELESCAAGQWCYDMDKAPRDGQRILCFMSNNRCEFISWIDGWWDAGDAPVARMVAWASINIPKKGKE